MSVSIINHTELCIWQGEFKKKKNTKMFYILVIKMKSLSTNHLEQVKKIIKKYTTIGLWNSYNVILYINAYNNVVRKYLRRKITLWFFEIKLHSWVTGPN